VKLKKLLKKSVKAVRKGEKITLVQPVDLPKGLKTDAKGEFLLPTSPATCADLLYEIREKRLGLQRQCERFENAEAALRDFFIETLPASHATGVAGEVARVQIETRPVPQVEDWDKLYTYIGKNKAFELLQRRLGEGAAKEILDAGRGRFAGLTVFMAKKVSCTKI
jgi:hypothetical protein